jgi:broad specificity phosphatase PhoE
MASSFNKDHAIIAQNATAPAAQLTAAIIGANPEHATTTESAKALFDNIRTHIFQGSLALAGGAADPVDEDPALISFNSGKMAGKTIAEAHAEDPTYITWVIEKGPNAYMKAKCKAFLGQ